MHKPLTTGQPLLMYLELWSLTIPLGIHLQILDWSTIQFLELLVKGHTT